MEAWVIQMIGGGGEGRNVARRGRGMIRQGQ